MPQNAENGFGRINGRGISPENTQEIIPAPVIKKLNELITPPENDPNEIFKDRWLCRGGISLLVGQTGIGKSTFIMQGSMLWSLGKDAFGIRPARPLRILIIQAENDEGGLAIMRNSLKDGMQNQDSIGDISNEPFDNLAFC